MVKKDWPAYDPLYHNVLHREDTATVTIRLVEAGLILKPK